MPFDLHSAISWVGDTRTLVFYLLGYISCIGTICILFKRVNNRFNITVDTHHFKYIVVGEYTASVVVGSVFWYSLAQYPVLLWLPISLFLIISL